VVDVGDDCDISDVLWVCHNYKVKNKSP